MFIQKINIPKGTVVRRNDDNFKLLKHVLEAQFTLIKQRKILKLFNLLLDEKKVEIINMYKKIPSIDAFVDHDKLKIFIPLEYYINQGFTSVSIFRKITLAVIFGIVAYVFRKNPTKIHKSYIISYMTSFYFIYIARYNHLAIQDKNVSSLFNTVIVRYLFKVLYDIEISKVEIKSYLEHYDSYKVGFIYEKYPYASKDALELGKRLDELGLLEFKKHDPKYLLPFTRFQMKTLYAIDRLNYLLAVLFVSQFFSDGLFDDFLSKINVPVFKKIISEIEHVLSLGKVE